MIMVYSVVAHYTVTIKFNISVTYIYGLQRTNFRFFITFVTLWCLYNYDVFCYYLILLGPFLLDFWFVISLLQGTCWFSYTTNGHLVNVIIKFVLFVFFMINFETITALDVFPKSMLPLK